MVGGAGNQGLESAEEDEAERAHVSILGSGWMGRGGGGRSSVSGAVTEVVTCAM